MWTRLLAAALVTVSIPAAGQSAESGKWHNDTAHGYERYWTENVNGSRFTIWCPKNHNVRGALLSVDINGHRPPDNSVVRFELDHKLVKFRVGKNGYIRTNCATCTDNLTYFWHQLRSSVKFVVQFEDKQHYAGFSLRGAKETTPHSVCASRVAETSQ